MPTAPVTGLLQNPGDTVQVVLNADGVGNRRDQTVVMSLTGAFTAMVVAVEAVPLGQPLTPALAPVGASEWVSIASLGRINNTLISSPVGPLTSTGVVGSGFSYTIPVGFYSIVRMRLVSAGSGSAQAALATMPTAA